MSNLKKFAELIHVDQAIISKLLDDDTESDIIVGLSQDYLKKRETFVLSQHEAELKKLGSADATIATLRKQRKLLNDKFSLGYSSDDIKNFDHDEFLQKFEDALSSEKAALQTDASKAVQTQLDDFKNKFTAAVRAKEEAESRIDKVKAEYEEKTKSVIRDIRAKELYNKMVLADSDLADVPQRDFLLESISEKIFKGWIVEEDGKIKTLEGGIATHPDKDVNIEHVKDLYDYYKSKAGLNKLSNAGSHAFSRSGANSTDPEPPEVTEMRQRFKEGAKRMQTF